MSITSNHRQYAQSRAAAQTGHEDAEVLEIFPGARDAAPVSGRTRGRLMGSEVGMATAE